jgi:hypothetical protein
VAEAVPLEAADVGFGAAGALEYVEAVSPVAEEDLASRGVGLVAAQEGCFT